MAAQFTSVDDYVAAQPPDVQQILGTIRERVIAAAPAATEAISYGIPTFKLDGYSLMHTAAWKHHIAIYPIPHGDEALERDIDPYRSGKGTLKFPLGKPFPYELVDRLIDAALGERSAR